MAYSVPTENEIRTALTYIDATERQTWVSVGTALKTEFGETGFNLFDEWSQTAQNYKSKDAKDAWRSFRIGKSNIGYIINQAKQNGWVREKQQPMNANEMAERQRRNKEMAKQAENQRIKAQKAAAEYAQNIWNKAKPVNPNHAYLQKKGIDHPSVLASIRQDKDALILPLRNRGEIVGIQKIFANGDKRFNRDIEKKGSALIIGNRDEMQHGFLMAEGFATAATFHIATGKPVVVAFDAGNLKEVSGSLKEFVQNHQTPVLICADKDENQTGEIKAQAAAEVLEPYAQVITPDFSEAEIQNFQAANNGKKPTDFNDLQMIGGIERVKETLSGSITVKNTVIASINEVNAWQSPDLESEMPTTGNLNDKKIATTATQSRNDELNSGSLNDDKLMLEQSSESVTMTEEMPKSERSAWEENFPPAITNGNLGSLNNDPDYQAAKAGDVNCARNLVARLLKDETIAQMIEQFQPRKDTTVLLPILAQETVGKNKIPLAIAERISKKTGIPFTDTIYQTNHIGRTQKNADSRLLSQPTFGGTVEQDKNYILIDDTLTMGGTLASLRSFVIQNGGRVSGCLVMSSKQYSLQLAPSAELLDNIRLKHGENIEDFLQKELGYGLKELTNSEAAHIYAYANVDTIRTRLAQTRYAESRSMAETTTFVGQSEDFQLAQLTVALRENYHPKAIIKTEQPKAPCQGLIVHIGDNLVVQQVESGSRYFQAWNKQDLDIPLKIGDKAKIYLDKQGKAQIKITQQAEEPNPETPRPPQGGFVLSVDNQSNENRQAETLSNPKESTMAEQNKLTASPPLEKQTFQPDAWQPDTTVIASEQSERGNLGTQENNRLNQEIATPATQVRNDSHLSGSLNDKPDTWQPENWQPDENAIDFNNDKPIVLDEVARQETQPEMTPQEKVQAAFETLQNQYNGYRFNPETQKVEVLESKTGEEIHYQADVEKLIYSAVDNGERKTIGDIDIKDLTPEYLALSVENRRLAYNQTLLQNGFPNEEKRQELDQTADRLDESIRQAHRKTETLKPPIAPPPPLDQRYTAVERKFMDNTTHYGDRTNLGIKTRVDYVDVNNSRTVLFSDKGNKLTTSKNPDAQTVKDMVEVAKAKGWDSVKLRGSKEFKRMAYIEMESQGIKTKGYSPSKEDLAIVEKLREERSLSGMENVSENRQAKNQNPTVIASEQSERGNLHTTENDRLNQEIATPATQVRNDSHLSGSLNNKTKQPEKTLSQEAKAFFDELHNNPTADKGGILLSHGKAPYQHNPDNKESYYATLQYPKTGEEKTFWGTDLERVIRENKIQNGDRISLTSTEKEPVRVRDGENTETMYQRNIWQAEIHEKANPDVKFVMMGQPQGNLNNDAVAFANSESDRIRNVSSNIPTNAQVLQSQDTGERLVTSIDKGAVDGAGEVPAEVYHATENMKSDAMMASYLSQPSKAINRKLPYSQQRILLEKAKNEYKEKAKTLSGQDKVRLKMYQDAAAAHILQQKGDKRMLAWQHYYQHTAERIQDGRLHLAKPIPLEKVNQMMNQYASQQQQPPVKHEHKPTKRHKM